jgi:squalene cyclase
MDKKNLDLKRITKTASLLILSGLSVNSIPLSIIERCIKEQELDGGWIAIGDTAWNTFFLKLIGETKYYKKGISFLENNKNSDGLWGRNLRDKSRIPVSGLILYLFPEELGNTATLNQLENLWIGEKNSLTYKAGYTLMAFYSNNYLPRNKGLINDTVLWLNSQQREDGSFAPWKEHPVNSDIFCTSIALLGLFCYNSLVSFEIFKKAVQWLIKTQLSSGIWPYHEIEDGASWGLYILSKLIKIF